MNSISSKNEYVPCTQRLVVAASCTCALSSIALLILLNYPSLGGSSLVFTASLIDGASLLTILISCALLQCQKHPQKQIAPESEIIDSNNPFNLLEVCLHIFSNLGVKDLIQCSLTCRSWHVVAEDKLFWRKRFILNFGMLAAPFLDTMRIKKACIFLPATIKHIEKLQYVYGDIGQKKKTLPLRYKEWEFKSKFDDVGMKKYGSADKSVILKSSESPLQHLSLQNGSLYGLREDVIDVWDCDTGELVNTFDIHININSENDRTCKSFFLANEKWIAFSHKRYAFDTSKRNKTRKNNYIITVEYIAQTTQSTHGLEEFIIEDIELWDDYTVHGFTAAIYEDILYVYDRQQIYRLDLNTNKRLEPIKSDLKLSNMLFRKNAMYILQNGGISYFDLLTDKHKMLCKVPGLGIYHLGMLDNFLVFSLISRLSSNDSQFDGAIYLFNLQTRKTNQIKAIDSATHKIRDEAKEEILELCYPEPQQNHFFGFL